ncbi:hypothetical protein Pmar_PMAR027416 [Perkinsus marinus ATCC 50983]|uniref:Uncharacterized protein n=1 Tax=Perkinsus marinus (strain ATCC 50983 / TXsc) TaxID=423536 RepID=C5KSI3_PERM5|nr:hypothetical protein Pmar_PMAR027416 [Perkinsus marinus ATCC 50983]EER12597.1 hypothetical protein Pmar_PMAR027416 [Perkinsus marinus ATCC 50983]|eukprot:XP_002780802.1 hypothetical protein Pmar_PMAR027416 [Perkinsus marinus ATCC 50983]
MHGDSSDSVKKGYLPAGAKAPGTFDTYASAMKDILSRFKEGWITNVVLTTSTAAKRQVFHDDVMRGRIHKCSVSLMGDYIVATDSAPGVSKDCTIGNGVVTITPPHGVLESQGRLPNSKGSTACQLTPPPITFYRDMDTMLDDLRKHLCHNPLGSSSSDTAGDNSPFEYAPHSSNTSTKLY